MERKQKRIGVTGGIGCGKSTLCKILESYNFPVFYSDNVVKDLYEQDNIKTELVELLGTDILSNGHINKHRLFYIINFDILRANKLRNFVYPKVMDLFDQFCKLHSDKEFIFMESALIFEEKLDDKFDYVISVIANLALRVSRVQERDKSRSLEDIYKIIYRQCSDEHRIQQSDWVIYNNTDKKDLIDQLKVILFNLLLEKSLKK